ncbi:MAG: hup [Gemmataceae bacterium]|nr:hup [Gemmataceae bacterium]
MTTHDFSSDAIRRAFETVAEILLKHGRAEVDGFGVFELYLWKARRARNPRTGERIDIPAKRVVRFKPAGALKARAAERPPEE